MAIERLRQPPRPVTGAAPGQTLYEVALNQAPSRAWRAALLRPPEALTTPRRTPEIGRVELHGDRLTFRAPPARLHAWLRWLDRWIAYANSVIEE